MILEVNKKKANILEEVLKEYKNETSLVEGGDGMFKYSINKNAEKSTKNAKAVIIALPPSSNIDTVKIPSKKEQEGEKNE